MDCEIISCELTVRDLAERLENFRVLFVQRNQKLIGSVTNGDFRRGIAAGASLNDLVTRVMNKTPQFIYECDNYQTRLEKVRQLPIGFRYLPVINIKGEIQYIVSDKALISLPNTAILMAGGFGTRLKSLTENLPKPMLKVGDKPILQMIIEQFRRAGISQFMISVNYKAEVIKEHFKDGDEFNVSITYIEEKDKLGTAGCLGLIEKIPTEPLFVMNCDIICDFDPHKLLKYHIENKATATVCVHEHRVTVPYGVMQTQDNLLKAIDEKPNALFTINAGIYLLNPECIKSVPSGCYFDMTSLLECILNNGKVVATYRLPSYWIDIGNIEDFQRANNEYHKNSEYI